jgi:hypothetical protein
LRNENEMKNDVEKKFRPTSKYFMLCYYRANSFVSSFLSPSIKHPFVALPLFFLPSQKSDILHPTAVIVLLSLDLSLSLCL